MSIEEIIGELCAMAGPSGFEQAVAARVLSMMSPFVDEVKIDVMGNVTGIKRSRKANAKKLLFDAHIDEIGFIITGREEGFLRFSTLGGVDPRMLPASEIKIMTEPPIIGIVGVMPPHALKSEETDKTIKTDDLYIDIGMTQEEALKAIPLGTPAVYNTGARRFGDDLICGKALDDRACLACILRALELFEG